MAARKARGPLHQGRARAHARQLSPGPHPHRHGPRSLCDLRKLASPAFFLLNDLQPRTHTLATNQLNHANPRIPPTMSSVSVPASTYRIQLHKEFTFDQAAAIAPYLYALGISHVYSSPYLQAAPGSMHGYD